jgi:hypothetical protein
MMNYLAHLDGNTVTQVDIASEGWIADFIANNPDANCKFGPTDASDFPSVDWTWSDEYSRFIPPIPGDPADWEYDPELWEWVYIGPPLPPPDEN